MTASRALANIERRHRKGVSTIDDFLKRNVLEYGYDDCVWDQMRNDAKFDNSLIQFI
jgi:hypothetical protein